MSLYYLSVTIHVLAALFWLGGMFFLGIVGAPVLRRVEPAALRQRLFTDLGERFRTAGWVAIAVLVVTGLTNLHFRGVLRGSVLGEAAFWETRYGTSLAWKLAAVGVMIALSAWHDFRIGPQSAQLPPDSPEALRMRRKASWTARINGVVGIVLVIVAVRLARGG
jgi:copper resistance protein D